jgi:response regulator NasT
MNALNVLVIEQTPDNNELEEILLNNKINTISMSLPAMDIMHISDTIKPNVILLNISQPAENVLHFISEINKVYTVPIILFSDETNIETVNTVIKAGVSAYIVDGIESRRIKSIINIAIARFDEQMLLKDELEKTKSKLEERKLLDRAKGILMKTRGFSEDKSYHTLRKLAMDRNIPIAEMAKNIISMAELLK